MWKSTLGLLLTIVAFQVCLGLCLPSRGAETATLAVSRAVVPPEREIALSPGPSAQPVSEEPALAGTGPDVVVIDLLADLYGPVVFDHYLHVNMCEFGGRCENCHHQPSEDRSIAACSTCHIEASGSPEQPGLKGAYHRQCLSCHREWSHENACGFCHEEASASIDRTQAALNRFERASSSHLRIMPTFTYETSHPGTPVVTFHHADHTELFGLSCVDCHEGASCNECHGPTPEVPVASREDLCLKCHGEQRCTFCHDFTPRPRFEHTASTGWNLGMHHAGLACSKCHEETTTFASPSSESCKACHRGGPSRSFDHAITGVPMLGSHAYFDCVQCHHSGGAEATASCDRCHTDRSYPDCVPGLPIVSSRLIGVWFPPLNVEEHDATESGAGNR